MHYICHGIAMGAEVELFAFNVSYCSDYSVLLCKHSQNAKLNYGMFSMNSLCHMTT